MRLYLDLETRWNIDLFKHGAVRCAADETAGVNCAAYAIDDSPLVIVPYDRCYWGSNLDGMVDAMHRADKIVSHNAQFEMAVLERVLGVKFEYRKWIDTMAKCAYYGYPRSLDDAAKALQCTTLKDIQGKAVMKKLVTGKFTPKEAPDDFARLYSYCATDVEAMRQIDRKVPDLPPAVQALWELDCEINDRGVPVDMRAIGNAIGLKAMVEKENDKRMSEITGGAVLTVNQTERLCKWLMAEQNVLLPDCTADTVLKALLKPLPPAAKAALELRQEAGLSSLAKFQKMQDFAVDGRLYHMFDWYGAHTGRPTGNGPQVMNLARSENPEYWAELLSTAPFYFTQISKPSERMKDGLRGVICTDEDKTFVGMDLAQIEARATGWVAGEQKFLDLFTTTDPYCTYGKTIFGREINKKDHMIERTASKASMLSLGFAGGIGAYQRVAENYKIDFDMVAKVVMPSATPQELAEGHRNYDYYLDKAPLKPLNPTEGVAVDILKQRYRRDFPLITKYWDQLEETFILGGQAGPIKIEVHPSGLRVITLPSGRQLFYHQVKVKENGDYSYQSRKGRMSLWKGVLIENVAQAINADISDWYKKQANQIAPVVHHCYDEFTMECWKHQADEVLSRLKALTATKPEWAIGLPLGFDYWVGRRYGK